MTVLASLCALCENVCARGGKRRHSDRQAEEQAMDMQVVSSADGEATCIRNDGTGEHLMLGDGS